MNNKRNRNNNLTERVLWFVSKPLFSTVSFPEKLAQIKMGR